MQDAGVELCWRKCDGSTVADVWIYSLNVELLDQWKQTKLVYMPEGIGPPKLLVFAQEMDWSDKGMMKMRNGGEVPGVRSKGTCQEGELVVNEMSDDHLEDIRGNSGVPGRARRRSPREDTP